MLSQGNRWMDLVCFACSPLEYGSSYWKHMKCTHAVLIWTKYFQYDIDLFNSTCIKMGRLVAVMMWPCCNLWPCLCQNVPTAILIGDIFLISQRYIDCCTDSYSSINKFYSFLTFNLLVTYWIVLFWYFVFTSVLSLLSVITLYHCIACTLMVSHAISQGCGVQANLMLF